jgi:WhiB family transcriptional regulator, redox-sensing transcriptional regulator
VGWRDKALCAQVPGDLWFPETFHGAEHRRARKICDECPVKVECLEYALVNRIDYGIWAGTLPLERRALRRKMRR